MAPRKPPPPPPPQRQTARGVTVTVDIHLGVEEIARLRPEQISAVLSGLAQLLAAQNEGRQR